MILERFDPATLHIVCTKCPAHAKLHLVDAERYVDGVRLWVECHGEHVFGFLSMITIHKARHRADNGPPMALLEDIQARTDEDVQVMRDEAEAEMLKLADHVRLYDSFLARRPP